ncbi:hypothetical protein M1N92_04365, partial [Dehalococcoidia bacterium]|nr:hypothetical protein [Dehalococcoidia bacterium]
ALSWCRSASTPPLSSLHNEVTSQSGYPPHLVPYMPPVVAEMLSPERKEVPLLRFTEPTHSPCYT